MCEVRAKPINRRLARNFEGLFPSRDLLKEPHVIVTLALQTHHRQSAMSTEMIDERQGAFQKLMGRMQDFKVHFDDAGRWCDFIDPATGAPFFTDSSTTLSECDERYRALGFEILELGCCRCLCCERFGQCLVMTSSFVQASEEEVASALAILEGPGGDGGPTAEAPEDASQDTTATGEGGQALPTGLAEAGPAHFLPEGP